jgi:hypothetical protein
MYINKFGAYLQSNQAKNNVMYYLKYETASHVFIHDFSGPVSCCLRQFEAGMHACIIKAQLDCAINCTPPSLLPLSSTTALFYSPTSHRRLSPEGTPCPNTTVGMVPLPFGVSFGDFVAFVKLCKDVAQALHESSGAQSQFQRATADLEGIGTVLQKVETLLSPTAPTYDAALLIASACHVHLNAFLPRIVKYKPHLQKIAGSQAHNKGRFDGVWSKIKWALCHFEEEVAKLKAAIAPLLISIGVLLQIDAGVRSARSEQEIAQVVRIVKDAVPKIEDVSLLVQQVVTTKQFDRLQTDLGGAMQTILQQFSRAATGTQIRNLERNTENLSAQLNGIRGAMTSQVNQLESLTQACSTIQDSNQAQLSTSTRQHGEVCSRLDAITSKINLSMVTELAPDFSQTPDSQSSLPGARHVHFRLTDTINNQIRFLLHAIGSLGALVAVLYAFLLPILQAQLRTCVTIMKTPRLLSGNNITLTDALNRKNLLPYEYFRNWSILEPWLRREFETCPGESRVARGDFAIFKQFSSKVGAQIHPSDWERSVFPGDRVVMSIHVSRGTIGCGRCGRCGAIWPDGLSGAEWDAWYVR